jgi:hypothetical protein
LAWLLIRETDENINLRMNVPLYLQNSGLGFNLLDDASLRVEFFYEYIWFQLVTEYQSWELSTGERQEELGGSLGFGVGNNLFFGGGVNWDYFLKNSSDGSEIPRSLGLSFYVGDKDRNRKLGLLAPGFSLGGAQRLVAGSLGLYRQLGGGLHPETGSALEGRGRGPGAGIPPG